jgi:hypothetical protein
MEPGNHDSPLPAEAESKGYDNLRPLHKYAQLIFAFATHTPTKEPILRALHLFLVDCYQKFIT